MDFKENLKKNLKNIKTGLEVSSNPSNLFDSLSEEYQAELKNNKSLNFKHNLSKSNKKYKQDVKLDLSSFFSAISELKQKEIISEIKQDNLLEFFEELSVKQEKPDQELVEFISEQSDSYEFGNLIKEDSIVEDKVFSKFEVQTTDPKQDLISDAAQTISKEEFNKNFSENYTNTFTEPSSKKPDAEIKALQNKLKFLEDWIAKISLAGPGGGEVNFRYLDDVNPNSIGENKYLTYNQDNRKFYFDYVTSNTINNNTTLVTSNTYTISPEDYYVGINYSGPTTINLQQTAQSGKVVIIKDESGNCSSNPITVTGNVDNDPDGFILRIDNGAIQMIYRNGWRII